MSEASRFEQEMNNQIHAKSDINDVVAIKEEGPLVEVISNSDASQEKENNCDRVNNIEPSDKDNKIENVIYVGSKKKSFESPIVQDYNIAQDETNIAQDVANIVQHDANIVQKEAIVKKDEGNTEQDQANTAQGEGNITQCEGNSAQSEGSIAITQSGKGKRKNKTELQMLSIEMKNYEVYGDKPKRFRKQLEHPVSYKEEELEDNTGKCHISKDSDDDPDFSCDDVPDFTCPICQKEYENKVALQNHIRIHNRTVQNYTCSLCSKKFNKNADLIAHKETHTGESFLCQECKLAFSDYRDYLLHNHDHLKQQYFNCSECGLRYHKHFYKQHVTTHFQKLLSCHLCSFVTNGEFNLKKHVNQHKYKFVCVECGKEMNSKCYYYEYHMSIHTGVKRVQCLYCGACFRSSNARDVHTRIHTDEKPYTCDICGQKSRQYTDMKRHKDSHSTEKKYTCDLCGNRYLHKYTLVSHMRSHTKKNLYECTECDAKFTSTGGLKTHTLFKHTSERPVECRMCNKSFINNNQYQKHCRAKYHLRNLYGVQNKQ